MVISSTFNFGVLICKRQRKKRPIGICQTTSNFLQLFQFAIRKQVWESSKANKNFSPIFCFSIFEIFPWYFVLVEKTSSYSILLQLSLKWGEKNLDEKRNSKFSLDLNEWKFFFLFISNDHLYKNYRQGR